MRFDVLTLFPEMMEQTLSESIIGRARQKAIIEIFYHNIRDFTKDKHNRVDDYPYGGSAGMLMQAEPVYDAYMSVLNALPQPPHFIYLSPQGKVLTQQRALELSKLPFITLLCGHYEGIDERVIEELAPEEISVGDYVLTGGEIPAMLLIDAVSRLVPGVLSSEESYTTESHFSGLLEFPQYTRPSEFRGKTVPEVLLSGHHANIEKWRLEKSLERTKEKRPDLYEKYRNSHKGLKR